MFDFTSQLDDLFLAIYVHVASHLRDELFTSAILLAVLVFGRQEYAPQEDTRGSSPSACESTVPSALESARAARGQCSRKT